MKYSIVICKSSSAGMFDLYAVRKVLGIIIHRRLLWACGEKSEILSVLEHRYFDDIYPPNAKITGPDEPAQGEQK